MSPQEDLARADRFRGCLLGLACRDALGTTVEFHPRGTFEPVTDMESGGPFGLRPDEWTDDTSMALCLARSLLETGGFDAADQMERYVRWWRDGYLSSTGDCFDIGNTVATAVDAFQRTGEPFSGSTHPRSAGNGSIMRLAPVPMFFAPDREAAIHHAARAPAPPTPATRPWTRAGFWRPCCTTPWRAPARRPSWARPAPGWRGTAGGRWRPPSRPSPGATGATRTRTRSAGAATWSSRWRRPSGASPRPRATQTPSCAP